MADEDPGFPDAYPMLTTDHSFANYNSPDRPKYEYEVSRRVDKSDDNVHLEAGDSPARPLPPPARFPPSYNPMDIEQVSVKEQFEMYLMWKPDGGERVPLGMISWGWEATANVTNNAPWTLALVGKSEILKNPSSCPKTVRQVSPRLSLKKDVPTNCYAQCDKDPPVFPY